MGLSLSPVAEIPPAETERYIDGMIVCRFILLPAACRHGDADIAEKNI